MGQAAELGEGQGKESERRVQSSPFLARCDQFIFYLTAAGVDSVCLRKTARLMSVRTCAAAAQTPCGSARIHQVAECQLVVHVVLCHAALLFEMLLLKSLDTW